MHMSKCLVSTPAILTSHKANAKPFYLKANIASYLCPIWTFDSQLGYHRIPLVRFRHIFASYYLAVFVLISIFGHIFGTYSLLIRTFIRHKDRQYKIETGTDRITKDIVFRL